LGFFFDMNFGATCSSASGFAISHMVDAGPLKRSSSAWNRSQQDLLWRPWLLTFLHSGTNSQVTQREGVLCPCLPNPTAGECPFLAARWNSVLGKTSPSASVQLRQHRMHSCTYTAGICRHHRT
jgi:hypothetical protein